MIDEVLAFSRMSLLEMHFAPTDLEPLVRRVVHELDAGKGDRRIIWLIGRLPTVQADPALLRQAIREPRVQRPPLHAGAGNRAHPDRCAGRRRGTGVFRPRQRRQFRHEASRKDVRFGPGAAAVLRVDGGAIRLAHVQRIIQRHGGRLWTGAVPDGGATSYFSLPGELAEPKCIPTPQ